FGIPVLGYPGAEADDVIATLARQTIADTADVYVRILSGDKDLQQLLGDRVVMLDIHKDRVIDTAVLREEKGIAPDQVGDVLALMGDKVDNIPGVPGIGPKTATELIRQFGSIDGIYAQLDQIKGKRRENLEGGREQLLLSRQLVALKDDLPVATELGQYRLGTPDIVTLKRLFGDLGFRRHAAELDRLFEANPPSARQPSPAPSADPAGDELFPGLFDSAPAPAAVSEADLPPPPGVTTAAAFDYGAVTTRKQLRELVAVLRNQSLISVDTETVGFGRTATLCGISFAWQPGHAVYLPVRSPAPQDHLDPATVLEALRPILVDPKIGKCGHNLKFDLLVLRAAGVEMQGVVFDSMIASFLLGLPAHGLDALSRELLQHQAIPISRLIGPKPAKRGAPSTQRTMAEVPLDQIVPYAAEDADMALRLRDLLAPRLTEDGLDRLARDIEMPLAEVLAEMEWNGIRVDPAVLETQKRALAERINVLRRQIWEAAGTEFNPDSPKQLAAVLFRQLKLPVIKRGKTGPSTDAEVLLRLADPNELPASVPARHAAVPRLIVEYRQLTKLVNTYLDSLREAIDPRTERVHASFHQTGTATGRLSSSDPNLQNIPVRTEEGRQVRKAFVAAPGQAFVTADYSQIELRVLAHLSEDPGLIAAFRQDADIHRAVAAQVFGVAPAAVTPEQRGHAKVINFGIIYGVTPWG
ncbi:DNA polymerase I, partial [bacterium]|nr:DNA polymerase I [bacterium]